jgi:hypothetical protein
LNFHTVSDDIAAPGGRSRQTLVSRGLNANTIRRSGYGRITPAE